MDKIEACVLGQNVTQTKLVAFLECFEGKHGEKKSLDSAQTCASDPKVGLDFAPGNN